MKYVIIYLLGKKNHKGDFFAWRNVVIAVNVSVKFCKPISVKEDSVRAKQGQNQK